MHRLHILQIVLVLFLLSAVGCGSRSPSKRPEGDRGAAHPSEETPWVVSKYAGAQGPDALAVQVLLAVKGIHELVDAPWPRRSAQWQCQGIDGKVPPAQLFLNTPRVTSDIDDQIAGRRPVPGLPVLRPGYHDPGDAVTGAQWDIHAF